MKKLVIGKIRINPLLLAPMVDVTDLPFRYICKKSGAGMTYTEMIHTEAITHENRKTKNKMFFIEEERPIGIQITSNNIEGIKRTSNLIKDYDLVDLNCGCPSHLTIDHKSGAYLMKSPEKIGKMIKILKKNHEIVTAKIRLGFDKINIEETSKIIEKSGADAITIHGRLAKEGRNIPANWDYISKIKKKIGIPVIGNGDINDEKSAEKMLEITDGGMIARAAIGDPDIFNRINHYLKTGRKKQYSFKKNLKLYKDYINLGEKYGVRELNRIKYIGGKLIQRFEGAPKKRDEFMRLKSFNEINDFINNLE